MSVLGKLIFIIGISLIAQHLWKILTALNLHKTVYNHSPGPCHLVPGVDEGSEDMYTLSDGKTLITTGLKFGNTQQNPLYNNRKGHLLLFDFNDVKAGVSRIKLEGIDKLNNPHGIGVWEADDAVTVFVVNHGENEKEMVVMFEYDRDRNVLQHIKTITDPLFKGLNDVVPTSPRSFYATNLYHSQSTMVIEAILMLKWGCVVHYDGTRVLQVTEGLVTPNGITMSPDAKYVYIASSIPSSLLVYKRRFDNSLEFHKSFPLYSSPDNVQIDNETGDIWIGAQPVMYDCVQHLDDPNHKCPSQVLRLKMQDGDVTYIEEVYSEDDLRLKCATSASYYKGAMLVGSIMHKLLYCQVLHLD